MAPLVVPHATFPTSAAGEGSVMPLLWIGAARVPEVLGSRAFGWHQNATAPQQISHKWALPGRPQWSHRKWVIEYLASAAGQRL